MGIFDFNSQIAINPFITKKMVEKYNNNVNMLMESVPHGRSGIPAEHVKRNSE